MYFVGVNKLAFLIEDIHRRSVTKHVMLTYIFQNYPSVEIGGSLHRPKQEMTTPVKSFQSSICN